jgi:hydrogenase maturation protease
LDILANRRKVIVIDAVDCDADPGTVLRLTPHDLVPRNSQDMSLHDLGLLETLTAAGHLGVAPEEVIILGVRPDDVSCGLTLSATIAALVPKIVQLVLAELGVSHELCPAEMTTASGEMEDRP